MAHYIESPCVKTQLNFPAIVTQTNADRPVCDSSANRVRGENY
jgi:hypothetical protein